MPFPELSKERWEVIGPHFDQALDMPPAEAAVWLQALRLEDPELASTLEGLLKERELLADSAFLEGVTPPRPLTPASAGQRLGAYTLLTPIGRGGMGQVWLAGRSDGRYSGRVAVKILDAGVSEEAFKREAGILARLTHPNIAHLIDAGVSPEGQPHLVLEYVDGERLDGYCDSHGLDVEARLRLFLDVLVAVGHAHANLIVHRDIKPSNVLVAKDGRAKLLDFGIAKLIAPGSDASQTLEGRRALTPDYAAPEQLSGGPITTATDIYALGVMLYVLLTGSHPAGAARESSVGLVKAILESEPRRPSLVVAPGRRRRALRGDLDAIVARALEKSPQDRYASVIAMADDVRRHLRHEPVSAQPPALGYRARKFVRRNRLPVGLTAFVVLALVAGLTGTLWQARAAARQRDLALAQLDRAESINEFTSFLLGHPSGKPQTIHETLERAERMIEERSAQDHALAVDLLVTVGGIYAQRNEAQLARRILERAYQTSQAVADPAIRARALCAWAGPAQEDNLAEARRLLEAGLALTSAESRFDGVAAECLMGLSTTAADEGNATQASEAGERALARLSARPEAFKALRAAILEVLAAAKRMQGDTAGADRRYAEAFEELKRLGRGDTTDAAILRNNWAMNVANTSSVEALAMYQQVIASFEESSPGSAPARTRINEGVLLLRLGRYTEARSELEAARGIAQRQGSPQNVGRADCQIARACRALGDLDCARAALREAGPLLLSTLPPTHRVLADFRREQGLLAAAEGDAAGAERLLAEAIAIHEQVPEKHVSQIETLLDAGRWALDQGRHDDAEERGRTALALSGELRATGGRSAWVGLSELLLAEVRTRRDPAGARGLFRSAQLEMEPTLGAEHPRVLEARRRLAAGL